MITYSVLHWLPYFAHSFALLIQSGLFILFDFVDCHYNHCFNYFDGNLFNSLLVEPVIIALAIFGGGMHAALIFHALPVSRWDLSSRD